MLKQFTILQMNDSHGYLEEHFEHFFSGSESKFVKVGGYAGIKFYVDMVRKLKNDNVLFFDGGDTFHGTYPVVNSEGEILTPLLTRLNLDAMTAHWDFAYGPKKFKKLLSDLNYPMLAINVYDKESDKLVFDPYIIKEVDGVRVGIIGIAATIVDKVMPKHFSEGLYFTLGNTELPSYIEKLKQQENVDVIVVLSHLGFPQEVKLAKEISGIDILLSAHTHNRTYEPTVVNETIILQSGCHGSFLGHLDITYDIDCKKIVAYKHDLVILDEKILKDKEMEALVDAAVLPFREKLDQVIGVSKTDLSRSLVLESTMDNFLLNAIIDYTQAEMAFSNGWRYGVPIPAGDITLNDLYNIIPVNPKISKVKLSGREVWDMMEENLERTFALDPYDQMGGYVKRAMGINVYFKIENSYGQRIQYLFVNGEKIDYDRIYDVAFVTSQGVPEKYGTDRHNLDAYAVDVLVAYVKKKREIFAPLVNTVVAI